MTVGVLTTSFPRHAGDFAGCFVEDLVRREAASGRAVDVIAAGSPDTGWVGGSRRAGRPSRAGDASLGPSAWPSPEPSRDGFPPSSSPSLPITVWRVSAPIAAGGATLFYGAGAPEVLEAGGANAWMQALAFWGGLCELTRARAGLWSSVVAHWLVPCALAARALVPHLPLTAYAHSGDVALLERLPLGPSIGRWLARPGVDLVFVSADLQRRFALLTGLAEVGRVAPATTAHLGDCADPLAGEPSSRSPAVDRAGFRNQAGIDGIAVLSVGRLVPIKGFDILVRAVALASARWQGGGGGAMTVIVLGDGPERARLEAMARRMSVDLRLPGFVARDDVRRWMAAADLYVQPSRRLRTGRTEGLPVAAVEALRERLPVVASNTGGLSELEGLSAPGGPRARPPVWLVPPDDPGALASALHYSALGLARAAVRPGDRHRTTTGEPASPG